MIKTRRLLVPMLKSLKEEGRVVAQSHADFQVFSATSNVDTDLKRVHA